MFTALGISLVMENGEDGWFCKWGSNVMICDCGGAWCLRWSFCIFIFLFCTGWLGRNDYDGHDGCMIMVRSYSDSRSFDEVDS